MIVVNSIIDLGYQYELDNYLQYDVPELASLPANQHDCEP